MSENYVSHRLKIVKRIGYFGEIPIGYSAFVPTVKRIRNLIDFLEQNREYPDCELRHQEWLFDRKEEYENTTCTSAA